MTIELSAMAAEYEKPEFPETHIVTDPDNSIILSGYVVKARSIEQSMHGRRVIIKSLEDMLCDNNPGFDRKLR